MFFTNHPLTKFKDTLITDISVSVSFLNELKNSSSCISYRIQEGDTPESISNDFYDTQDYSWVILLINGMRNVTKDWPLSSTQFNSYLQEKYGDSSALFLKLDSIKKYDIKKGDEICVLGSTPTGKSEVIDWIPSYSKLVIKNIDNFDYSIGNTLALSTSSTEQIAVIGRVVKYSLDSLNHFELEKEYIDPLTGHLQAYINNLSNEYVITDYEYEMNENDNKRFIFVPKKEIIKKIEKQYEKYIKTL